MMKGDMSARLMGGFGKNPDLRKVVEFQWIPDSLFPAHAGMNRLPYRPRQP